MAMHQGFDLSRFKKVSTDDKATTMRHSNGHEVKIVHSALSPKMREQIEALPMHEAAPAPQNMARGGVVKKYAEGTPEAPVAADPNAMDPSSPEPAADLPPGADLSATNAANRPAGIPPPPAQDESAEPAPEAAPDPNTIDVIGHRPPPSAQDLDADDAAWEHDLANGHIHPKTYNDLFEKKDTLGKIGTLFGLIVGGAGAGLTHQPNMAMEMMNRTIENDLRAQTQSKHNATNYYNSAMNMLKGQSDIEYQNSQTALNKLPLVAAQDLADKVAKMPPGPFQAQAAGLVQQLLGAVRAKNAARNQQTSQGLAERAAGRLQAAPHNKAGGFAGPVNDKTIADLSMIGPRIGIGDLTGEAGAVKQMRGQWGNFTNAFGLLDTAAAGQSQAALADASGVLAQAALAFGTGGKSAMMSILGSAAGPGADMARKFSQYREAIKAQVPGIPEELLPSIYDFNSQETRKQKMESAARWFDANERGATPGMAKAEARSFSVRTPAPYLNDAHRYAKSPERRQPKGAGGRSQPLATPEEAKAGNVFPDQPKGEK